MIDTVVRETWDRISERLRDEIGERFHDMWFSRCSVMSLKRGVLAIGVPNLFIREWVEEHYASVLDRVAGDEMGAPLKVAVKVDPELFREMRQETDRIDEAVDRDGDSVDGKSLDLFLTHPGVELAVRALKHVATGKAPPMNPLVIYGGEGVGKTHLASSAVHLFPDRRIYRVTGEEFARRFAWNLKTRKIDRFREQISSADVVILDDAQQLAGKTVTQREMAALTGVVRARGGQMVILLDRHPKEVSEFEPTWSSVLMSGMLQEMAAPDEKQTVLILESLLKSARRRIPTALIETVTTRCGGSVKRLDRLIRKIYAFAGLTGEPVNEAFLDRHLDEIAGPTNPEERRLETILSAVEDHFDVERSDLLSKKKTKALSPPRGVAVYLMREQCGQTFKEIGRHMGDRSHTSVYLMYKKYSELIPQQPELQALVREAGRRMMTSGA